MATITATTATPFPTPRERRAAPTSSSAAVRLALGALAVLTALGGWFALKQATAHHLDVYEPPTAAHSISESVPTSFGYITVTGVEKIKGVPMKAMPMAAHGISKLVDNKDQQFQATLQITSRLDRDTAAYSAEQFSVLLSSGGPAIAPWSSTILAGRLQPHAQIEGHLGFVAPRNGANAWLRFIDPGTHKPIFIDLGRGDRVAGATDDHH